MSQKRKLSQEEKTFRRLREVELAEQKARGREVQSKSTVATKTNISGGQATDDTRFHLPIVEIKKDLLKNIIYLVLAIGVVFVLKNFGGKLLNF